MEKTPKWISIEDISVYADFEKWVKQKFPWRKFSSEEINSLLQLVRKAKKLFMVEKELAEGKQQQLFSDEIYLSHTEFLKKKLKAEKEKRKIWIMVSDALKSNN